MTETQVSKPDAPADNRFSVPTRQAPESRYRDASGHDPLDKIMQAHRLELESLHNQINNVDRTIEVEQQRLRDIKASLDSSYQAKARLLHLRGAMLNFVLELESREID